MIPADLLDKLREKDPELWIRYTNNDFVGKVSEAWLQHCLQEAIRPPRFAFSIIEINDGYYIAQINEYGKWHIEQSTNSPAEALLRAYLAAIQEAT